MTDPTPRTPPTTGRPTGGSTDTQSSPGPGAEPADAPDDPVPDPAADEVAAYLAAVRSELADLPPDVVEEMVDGLEADLGETARDTDGPLLARLGSPAAYAAELRTAAGVPEVPRPRVARLRERLAPARRAAGAAGRLAAGPAASAWWLLRGVVLASLVWVVYQWLVPGRLFWAHAVEDLVIPGVLCAAIVVGSIEAGRRRAARQVDPSLARRVLRGAGQGAVVAGLLVLVGAGGFGRGAADLIPPLPVPIAPVSVADPLPEPTVAVDDAVPPEPDLTVGTGLTYEGEGVANLFAYGPDGMLLEDVRLVDDRGRTIQLPSDPVEVDRDGDGVLDGWLRYQARPDSPRAPYGVFPLDEVLSPELDPRSGWSTTDTSPPVGALPPLDSESRAADGSDGPRSPG